MSTYHLLKQGRSHDATFLIKRLLVVYFLRMNATVMKSLFANLYRRRCKINLSFPLLTSASA